MNPEFFHGAFLSHTRAFHCLDECLKSRINTGFQVDAFDDE